MKIQVAFVVALAATALAAQTNVSHPATTAKPAAGAAAAGTPALPPTPTVSGPSKVATINIEQAIFTTVEGKRLSDALTARFKPKEDELRATQAELVAMNSKLNSGGNTMSQSAKDDLQRQITAKQRDFQQAGENTQSDMQAAQNDLMNTVGVKMMPLIQKYAEDHGYTYIMDVSMGWPQSPVLYFNPGTQITGDIVKIYDGAHPAGN